MKKYNSEIYKDSIFSVGDLVSGHENTYRHSHVGIILEKILKNKANGERGVCYKILWSSAPKYSVYFNYEIKLISRNYG